MISLCIQGQLLNIISQFSEQFFCNNNCLSANISQTNEHKLRLGLGMAWKYILPVEFHMFPS